MNKLKLVSTFICLTLMLVLIPTVGIYAKQKQIRMRGASGHPPAAPHCAILKMFEKLLNIAFGFLVYEREGTCFENLKRN